MKNIIKYAFVAFASFAMTSCLVDDNVTSDSYDSSPNLVGFTTSSFSATASANGNTYDFNLPVQVTGPTKSSITGEFTANVSVDAAASTAVEGVHFMLPNSGVTLSADNNLISSFPITVLTDGILPPLAENPYVTLKISEVSNGDLLPNGRTGSIKVTLLYLCSSDLAGTYNVSMHYVNAGAGIDTMISGVDTINQIGDGQYRTEAVGHWEIIDGPGAIGGTPGFNFVDVCNDISIPSQNLVELYSNLVEGVSGASNVDPVTGIIYFEYTVCASGACREYFATYTPQ